MVNSTRTFSHGSSFTFYNLLFSQSIVFKWLDGLLRINRRSEDIVQSKLPWKNVFHYMDCISGIASF